MGQRRVGEPSLIYTRNALKDIPDLLLHQAVGDTIPNHEHCPVNLQLIQGSLRNIDYSNTIVGLWVL